MQIRIMTINDYEYVYNLWLSCKGIGLNNLDDSKSGIEKFLKRNPETCFVAIENEETIGSILAGNDGRRGYIYHTAVSTKHQRKGVGRKLVEAAMNALEEQGINKVALVVFEHNNSGNGFWEKVGFDKRNDLIYRNKAINKIERIDT